MHTILLTAMATAASAVAIMLPFVLYANTYTSATARTAVALWGASAAVALWYFAIISQGTCS